MLKFNKYIFLFFEAPVYTGLFYAPIERGVL